MFVWDVLTGNADDHGSGIVPRTESAGILRAVMLSTADFKRNLRILVDGAPYSIIEHTVQSATARGSQTLVKAKLRHLLTGEFVEKSWRAGELFEEPDLVYRQAEFLYADGSDLHFMDQENFEQFSLPGEDSDQLIPWLVEGLEVRAIHFQGNVAAIELPKVLIVEVLETEPAVRGNTASGKVMKRAVVANGAEIQVPLFVERGEKLEVDPHEARFIRRA
jgi:elongation factor P